MLLEYMTDAPLYSLPSQSPKWSMPRILGFGSAAQTSGKQWMHDTAEREIEQCGDAQPRWDKVWDEARAAEALVAPDRRQFYGAEVLTGIAINRQSNRMLLALAKSIHDAQNGDAVQARQEAQTALQALDDIRQMQASAEYGKWKNWYRGDWLTGVYRTRQLVEVFTHFLGDPLTHLAAPVIWDGWEAYYHIMHYEGDRSADVN
jgi:hypothetical protein